MVGDKKEEKQYEYFEDLKRGFLHRRLKQLPQSKREKRKLSDDDPRRIQRNIAPIPRPPIDVIVKKPRMSVSNSAVVDENTI